MTALRAHESIKNEFEEPSEADVRLALGLRPTTFVNNPKKGEHPDGNACPEWCWAAEDDHGHEVDWNHPDRATHSLGYWVLVLASLYRGRYQYNGGCSAHIDAATFEVEVTQLGQREPVVSVRLRNYPAGKEQKLTELMRLRVEDARELITALTFITDVAEGKRESIR